MTDYLSVRFRRGVVGETKRTVHLVPVPTGDTMPPVLVAICGTEFGPEKADLLDGLRGMPCVHCEVEAIARQPLAKQIDGR
jgi:hypothetical protein